MAPRDANDPQAKQQSVAPIKVTVTEIPPAQIYVNAPRDGKYFTGVGSIITITVTDANGKPISGAKVHETNTGGTAGKITQRESDLVTEKDGSFADIVAVGMDTEKPQHDVDRGQILDSLNEGSLTSTTEQTLTITTSAGQQYQATYQRTVTNETADGELLDPNTNGVPAEVRVSTTTPEVKPLPKSQ